MIYRINLSGMDYRGSFFHETEFGSFFITEKLPKDIVLPSRVTLTVHEDRAEADASGTEYIVYPVTMEGQQVILFGDTKSEKREGISYIGLDELSQDPYGNLFLGSDVMDYLSRICLLPNGNFVVGSVQDYITTIEEMKKRYPGYETFFRGHYYYKYTLVPSLYRKKKYYDNESYMYLDFKTQFYKELSSKKYIEILTTMQHYRMPTRLLDTTSNPLVALFMACDKPQNYKNKGIGIGEVVVMNEDIRNVKYADSNAVTLLSSLAVLETNYKQELYEKITESIQKKNPEIYKNCLAYKRFVAEVHSELPYFDESFFTPEVLLRPRHVKVGMINERIIAQSGSFILFGLCNYVTGEYQPLHTVTKERVFVVHREYIQKQLELLNINAGTMYPDKDHVSVAIMKSYD